MCYQLKNFLKLFISTYMLQILQFLHIKPIYVIIYYIFKKTSFKVNFSLRCIQRLFITNVATRQC